MKRVLAVSILAALLAAMMVALGAGTAMAQAQPVMGVAEFQNSSGAAWWRGGMGWDLAGMVTNELAATGKFRMVERSKLEHVLREQDLGASGRIRKGTEAKIGKVTGAQFLVLGTVTAYEENTSGTGGGISVGPLSFGGSQSTSYMAVDLRVVDTTTGEVAYVRTVEGKSESSAASVGIHAGFFGGNFGGMEKTPAGKAIRACVIEIVDYLQCVMVDRGPCLQEYGAKEQRRREKTKGAIKLDD